jgi:hypothetical protein
MTLAWAGNELHRPTTKLKMPIAADLIFMIITPYTP